MECKVQDKPGQQGARQLGRQSTYPATILLVGCMPWFVTAQVQAGDWPMWRYDAAHGAASPHELPEKLQSQWTRQFARRVTVWDDPLNQELMPYDRIFEPVVQGGRMFIGFNDTDKVIALDADTVLAVYNLSDRVRAALGETHNRGNDLGGVDATWIRRVPWDSKQARERFE